MASTSKDTKFSLPELLKYLNSHGLSMSDAIKCAGPLYKNGFTTPSAIGLLTESTLLSIGISDSESLKVLTAIGQPGNRPKTKVVDMGKRKRDDDLDLPPQDAPIEDHTETVNLEFNEVLDIELLSSRSVVINRAPIMAAWSTVVAERLGFKRTEALSMAQAFTDLNAKSKGASIGIFPKSVVESRNAGPSQPYVDLMGRTIPVFALRNGEWRAILAEEVVKPSVALGYLQRSFKQQLGSVIGAMRLLAESFPIQELSYKGMGLYYDFRPQDTQWGQKAEVKLSSLLDLRRFLTHKDQPKNESLSKFSSISLKNSTTSDELPANAVKIMPPGLVNRNIKSNDGSVGSNEHSDNDQKAKKARND